MKTLRVESLMHSPVLSTRASASLTSAREQMDAAGIRHLPVVDEHERLIGVVSHGDLWRVFDLTHAAEGKREQLRVRDVMKREVRTVSPSTPAADAAATMIENKIGSLPVVRDDGHLVGLITETDFLVIAQQALLGIEPAPHARA